MKLLSGHGYFRKYLHRIGETASPNYLYGDLEVVADAEHTVFAYACWQSYRYVLMSVSLEPAEYAGAPA